MSLEPYTWWLVRRATYFNILKGSGWHPYHNIFESQKHMMDTHYLMLQNYRQKRDRSTKLEIPTVTVKNRFRRRYRAWAVLIKIDRLTYRYAHYNHNTVTWLSSWWESLHLKKKRHYTRETRVYLPSLIILKRHPDGFVNDQEQRPL